MQLIISVDKLSIDIELPAPLHYLLNPYHLPQSLLFFSYNMILVF
jgi:hypothetical protein